ncbi:hypothetical protein E2562_011948 [Oryza meyeriana var. granulata]|uniref:Uncharacterized protein n=1 Tax=Oryza meyeriana var. granulata TaxID=110450 RepID=A0A6G1F752_9ORYZ|nr:hypothetical protein E2562_011948 [Oryza meyeriana var. granulata]
MGQGTPVSGEGRPMAACYRVQWRHNKAIGEAKSADQCTLRHRDGTGRAHYNDEKVMAAAWWRRETGRWEEPIKLRGDDVLEHRGGQRWRRGDVA